MRDQFLRIALCCVVCLLSISGCASDLRWDHKSEAVRVPSNAPKNRIGVTLEELRQRQAASRKPERQPLPAQLKIENEAYLCSVKPILRDKPGQDARSLLVIQKNFSLFVIEQQEDWSKIIVITDPDLFTSVTGWVESSSIVTKAALREKARQPMERERRKHERERAEKISLYPRQIQQLIREHKIKLGMTNEQVIFSWGQPLEINRTVTNHCIYEQWVYPGRSSYKRSYLYFHNGLLNSFQD